MKFWVAANIFDNIDSPDFTVEEKGAAIYEIMNLATHNGFTKAAMLKVIKWLWNMLFDIDKEDTDHET